MKIVVVGAGYVGLVTAACFSELGVETWCVDRDEARVDMLVRGSSPIREPELEEMLVSNHARGRLHFATALSEVVKDANMVFIAVGTPEGEDGAADLSNVFAVAEQIGRRIADYTIVVTKSTVPVGTARQVARTIRAVNPQAAFDVVSNPEFLREGHAVSDCMRPDRILIGSESECALAAMRQLYRPLRLAGATIQECRPETAELAKYAANSFLASKIAFINEVADLCEIVDADIGDVARAMGLDPRIGARYLQPGPGFGGSCLPKDTKAFARFGNDFGAPQRIVEAVITSDAARKRGLLQRVRRASMGSLCDKRVAVLGLTFKPGTDDVRESPALELVPALAREAAAVALHDPMGNATARDALGETGASYHDTVETAVEGADVVVILTDWDQFRILDLHDLKRRMRGEVLVDFRNLFAPADAASAGLSYHSTGRSHAGPDGEAATSATPAAAE